MLEIKGTKVVLKEAEYIDIDELYFWKYEDKEQEAKKWNGPYIIEEKVSKEKYIEGWAQQIYPGLPAFLVIKADDKAIGYVGAYWVDENTDWLETGIVIYDKGYWDRGYGSEAYKLWIDHLFQNTELHRLGMSTWSGNTRMIKAAGKLGMKEEARIRQARRVNDQYFDAVKMGVLRKEWEELDSD
ncbi:GNAT family N-acetyltransferase [Halobacillus sp. A1]|uniref:GNAT family N-acetyltransferase n=1 Tax=Halobacillus sp. A1 TaxID=2880262 RepID=UPI0020A66F9C|nr:GNAT family protein [Halobacillus sp. A1]MCP3033066.1 GNAT family N-acetyltransferase [Halobacillus sp. A1]